jgi:hypothetical protein
LSQSAIPCYACALGFIFRRVAEDLAGVLRVVVAVDPERPQEVEGGVGHVGERVVGDLVAEEPAAARLGMDPATHVLEGDGVHLAARHVLEDCARPGPLPGPNSSIFESGAI